MRCFFSPLLKVISRNWLAGLIYQWLDIWFNLFIRFESTHDVSRGMVAPFDRKALWQGKNENHFRPYLITPFTVSNCVCSADAGLVSVSDTKSCLISAKWDLLHYSSTFCQSFFSLLCFFAAVSILLSRQKSLYYGRMIPYFRSHNFATASIW